MKAIKDKITRWKNSQEKALLKEPWGLLRCAIKLLHLQTNDEDFFALWELIEEEWKKKN